MKHIYYKVAHRPQAEIDSFKDRYRRFEVALIPGIFQSALGFKVVKFTPSESWGTSHVVYIVNVKNAAQPLILRANTGFGHPETVMLTEKLITNKVARLGVPTNKILYADISRHKYQFDFQIQEMLQGQDLENHFTGSEESYDALSFELGGLIAKIHQIKLSGFGLFDEAATLKGILQGIHTSFYDYVMVCLESDLRYLFDAQVLSRTQLKSIAKLFVDYRTIIAVKQGVLVHHDLADHNIMYQEDRITGIFDWEAAVVGDPVLDLASCPTWKTHYPREEKLLEGYKRLAKLPEHFTEKMNIYRLRTMLWKTVFAIRMNILSESRRQKFSAALKPFKLI